MEYRSPSTPPPATTPRAEFLRGVRDELPLLVGVLPFGLIYGVLAIEAGIPPAAAQAMSAIVFAGSSQFLMAQLVAVGTPAVVIALAAGIVNLRHALYSASMAPYLRRLSAPWKWLLAYLLTDEAYAVTIVHFSAASGAADSDNPNHRHFYLLGAGLALWSAWQLSTAAGVFLGRQVPTSWSLDFTLALTFIGLVVPTLCDRAAVAAALAAGLMALVTFSLPLKLGLVLSALTGIVLGMMLEWRR